MEKAESLFESYNMAIEGSYNKVFMDNKAEDLLKIKEDCFLESIDVELKKWADTPMEELEGISPDDYFKSISSFEQLIELFKLGSKLCDKDLPDSLLERLKSFGTSAVDELLKLALDPSLLHSDEEMFISLMAIRIFGRWKVERVVDPLINLLLSLDFNNEIAIEEITEALIFIGNASISSIVDRLNGVEDVGPLDEHLLGCLIRIDLKELDKTGYDTVYRCIKNAFLKMSNKAFGAICLGDFGDGRAIPALRGYVERNRDTIDYQTYSEIKGAVIRLGGNMDDINISFRR